MPTLTPDASSACAQIAELKCQRSRRANLRRIERFLYRGNTSQQHPAGRVKGPTALAHGR
jgi:hypothetical protein